MRTGRAPAVLLAAGLWSAAGPAPCARATQMDTLRPKGQSLDRQILLLLKGRLKVLFSNSAAASGLEQPGDSREIDFSDDGQAEAEAEVEHRRYAEWFAAHRGRLKLHDPWLDELAKRKVD